MRLFRYLKGHGLAILLVFLLLMGRAVCELALPKYTADLVDVGIQQSGVENASTTVMTPVTQRAISFRIDDDDLELFEASYELADDGLFHLTDYGMRHRAQLDKAIVAAYANRDLYNEDVAGYEGAPANASAQAQESVSEQQVINAAIEEYRSTGVNVVDLQLAYLLKTGAIMMAFVALSVVISALIGLIASLVGARIGRDLRNELFRKVVSFSDAEIQKFSPASLITRATNDIQQIQGVVVMALRVMLYAPILSIGGVIMVARTNISMSWIIAVGIVAIMLLVTVLFALVMPKFKIMQKLIDRVNLVAREMLTGVPVVRAFGRQRHEQQRFDAASSDLMGAQLFTGRALSFMMPAMMLVMNGISALIVWVGAGAIDTGSLQTGDLIAFITYAMVIITSFLMIGMIAVFIPRAEVAAQRIDEVLSAELSIRDPEVQAVGAAELAMAGDGAQIAFNHVDFRFADSSENVLSDIDFVAEAGKTTAIIGPTGSGKSTVLKLIERFHDVTAGSITIDGIDVRDISQHDLRAQLGYVPQKPFLFYGTIASNVGYGLGIGVEDGYAAKRESSHDVQGAPAREGDPDELTAEEALRLDTALEVAQAADFVAQREMGIRTEVSQGGTNVSGGQRQRLAIARALATDARAFLFDDSFSALDYKTDAALRRALATKMRGKTVIVVAQRVATVLHADKIVVLEDGRVAGVGTHAQLMETCPAYRDIALSQLSEAELEGGDAR